MSFSEISHNLKKTPDVSSVNKVSRTSCYTQQSPSWEGNRLSASQEILCILWNLNVYYTVYKKQPPSPLSLSWAKLIQSMPPLPIALPDDPF